MIGPVVGQTRSNMSVVWVATDNVPDGLRRLADELDERGLGDKVVGLNVMYTGLDDSLDYQVDATVEEYA